MNKTTSSLGVSVLALTAMTLMAFAPTSATAATISSPQDSVSKSGLIGWWSFDGKDVSGTTVYDKSGNGNNGTLDNGAKLMGGKVGQGVYFDGVDDTVTVLDSASLRTSNFTVAAWLQLSSINSGYYTFVARDNSDSHNNYALSYDNVAGTWNSAYDPNWAVDNVSYTAAPILNQWYHFVTTYNDTTKDYRLFLNGAQVAQNTAVNTPEVTSGGELLMGWDPTNGAFQHMHGVLDEVRVYNRPLTQTEVSTLYRAGQAKLAKSATTNVKSGLIGWWTFDGPDFTDKVYDRSGQGNHGYVDYFATASMKTSGKIGQGARFDGTASSNMVNSNATNNDLGPLTASGWFTGGGALQALLYKSNDIGQGWEVFLDYNDTLCFVYYGTSQLFRCAPLPQAYPIQKWTHFTVVKDDATLASTSVHLYFDGVPVSVYPVDIGGSGSHDSDAGHALYIGREESGGFLFNGKMDDLRLYNRALTAAEVKQIYNEGGGVTLGKSQAGFISNDLIGYWSFNGPDFTDAVYDRSGQGNNGGVINTATATIKAAGKVGQGAVFTGDADQRYIGIGNPGVMNGMTALTVAAWAKVPSWKTLPAPYTMEEAHIVDKSLCDGVSDHGTFELLTYNQGFNAFTAANFGVYQSGGGFSSVLGVKNIADGNWHHLVGVYDGATQKLYVDGALESSQPAALGALSTNAYDLEIGGRCNLNNTCGGLCFWTGGIDEVRIYNRALTAMEIKRLYQSGK